MADTLDGDLSNILTKNGIKEEVIDQFAAAKCVSIDHFANWAEDAAAVQVAFLANTAFKDDPGQKARLRMAWRSAEAIVAKKLKRCAEGLADEAVDDPLDQGTQSTLEVAHRKAYGWPVLDPTQMGSDNLLGRIHREFIKLTPTMLALSRVRSLAQSQSGTAPKKKRMGDVTVIIGDEEVASELDGTLFRFIDLLEVLTNTWAVGGHFDVQYRGENMKYVTWPQACAYARTFRRKAIVLLNVYTESSVVDYTTQTEEAFRCKAIEAARGDPKVPWGVAITSTLKEDANIW